MLTTGCNGCCFLKSDDTGRGCRLFQMCVEKNGNVIAPGYCRLCRSNQWAQSHKTCDIEVLKDKVISENVFKFDLLILFDEHIHTASDLNRTLDSEWFAKYVQKVIIVDTTGFGDRKNISLDCMKEHANSIDVVVDSSAKHETYDQRSRTIQRISKQVHAKFFTVLSAGQQIYGLDILSKHIEHPYTRVIHWSMSSVIGDTWIHINDLNFGVFITKPYRALIMNKENLTFEQQLSKEEQDTCIKLTWFCEDVFIS